MKAKWTNSKDSVICNHPYFAKIVSREEFTVVGSGLYACKHSKKWMGGGWDRNFTASYKQAKPDEFRHGSKFVRYHENKALEFSFLSSTFMISFFLLYKIVYKTQNVIEAPSVPSRCMYVTKLISYNRSRAIIKE